MVGLDISLPPEGCCGCEWIQGDILDPGSYAGRLRGIDVVVHLAAMAHSVPRTKEEADRFWKVNLEGTKTLIAAAAEQGVRRFLHVSTVAVLSPSSGGIESAYVDSKRAAEREVLEFRGSDRRGRGAPDNGVWTERQGECIQTDPVARSWTPDDHRLRSKQEKPGVFAESRARPPLPVGTWEERRGVCRYGRLRFVHEGYRPGDFPRFGQGEPVAADPARGGECGCRRQRVGCGALWTSEVFRAGYGREAHRGDGVRSDATVFSWF